MKILFYTALSMLLLGWTPLCGQLSSLGHNPEVTHLLDRLETLRQSDITHLSVRNMSLSHIVQSDINQDNLSRIDKYDWQQLVLNIPEGTTYNESFRRDSIIYSEGIFKSFYKSPHSFLIVDSDDFYMKVDPIIHFGLGNDSNDDDLVFQNTRGLKIRSTIDGTVYFYTEVLENQQRFYNYIENEITRLNAIPGQGFFKNYQSGIIDRLNGWDFLNAKAYLGLKISKSIDLQLGHGRHFIGDGIRSMLLSDYANNYFYLQLNTRIWKFHYQNTFAELSFNSSRDNQGSILLPKKYMAAHYLDMRISPKLTIGLYEAVIFSRENNFEFQYLNPVILYRSVEQFLDSPDNAILGINIKWLPIKNWQLYGQLLIDELRTGEAFSGSGWWGNKIGYQIGMKAFDLFKIDHLDLQIEHNAARPFTYAHRDDDIIKRPTTSYSHFNQALAHPLGANFKETIIDIRYRPLAKIQLHSTILLADYGTDDNQNIGRNILSNYESRVSDFGNFTGQGIENNVTAIHLNASWQILPNYYVDLRYVKRVQNIEGQTPIKTNYWGLGSRVNVFNKVLLL